MNRSIARLCLLLSLPGLLLLSGCQTKSASPLDQPLVVRFYLEAKPGTPGVPLRLPVSQVLVYVDRKPVMVEYDVVNAEPFRVDLGWCLLVRFSPAAARDFYRLTATNQGRRLVLTFNDTPIGVRRIDQAIADGNLLIFVEVPDEDLPPLAERVNRTAAAIAKKSR